MPAGGGHRGALAKVAPIHSCIPTQPERQLSRRYALVARQLRARVQGRRGMPDLLLSDSCHGWAASPHDLLHVLKGLSPSVPVQVVSILSQVCVPALPIALVMLGCPDVDLAGHIRSCHGAGCMRCLPIPASIKVHNFTSSALELERISRESMGQANCFKWDR